MTPAASTHQLMPSLKANTDCKKNTRMLLMPPWRTTAGHTEPERSRSARKKGAQDAIDTREESANSIVAVDRIKGTTGRCHSVHAIDWVAAALGKLHPVVREASQPRQPNSSPRAKTHCISNTGMTA